MNEWRLAAELPWSLSREEDRRFHRILGLSLLCSLALGAIAPYIPVPEQATAVSPLPVRRVRLLEETVRPEPRVAPVLSTPATPERQASPQPVAEQRAARPPVSGTGVLALGEALSRLQNRPPRAVTGRQRVALEAETGQARSRTSLLSEDLTDLGGTVQLSVSRDEMLGATDLPDQPGGVVVELEPVGKSSGAAMSAESGGRRTEGDIQAVLDRHKGEVFTLYNRALRSDPDLQGKLLLRISINAAGRVTSCAILSSELGAVELERGLIALVEGIAFGSVPGSGTVTTRIPIEFFPQ